MRCAGERKNEWARHVKTGKNRKEVEREAVMKKLVGIWVGLKCGQN